MKYRNGDVIHGEWKGDFGKGTISHKDGSSYEVIFQELFKIVKICYGQGEFKGEKKHGFGTYILPSGNKYTGMYEVG